MEAGKNHIGAYFSHSTLNAPHQGGAEQFFYSMGQRITKNWIDKKPFN